MDNETRRGIPPMADYGGDDAEGGSGDGPSAFGDRTDLDVTPLSNAPGVSSEAAADRSGEGSNFATNQGRPGGAPEGGSIDITADMRGEIPDLDVRAGQVKGGTPGADPLAGPGQYGGEAGNLSGDKGELH